ncbi:hypothetical protein MDOR_22850 [Mycolicibacterium doricum]|uniref:HTTM domain-containing protein n=1 Tax=Mycolicibacterium doricum TaxID=126673 RepID=A0A7I7VS49_9MYCO|nr:hypothetical protein [Mycolicibacterium doricum]BBZ08116.1 hypothetical protein MDOR_22850 [Mycolicibacterium doricum]
MALVRQPSRTRIFRARLPDAGQNELVGGWVAAHDYRPAWELADWLTVAFELAILLALPWWRAFRTTLAIATTVFHLGVHLVMNMTFSHAVTAYGAFVSWWHPRARMGELRSGDRS